MQVSLRKVTSKYLQDMKVKARRKYEVKSHAHFARLGCIEVDGRLLTIRYGGGATCAHLSGNAVDKWTVHKD